MPDSQSGGAPAETGATDGERKPAPFMFRTKWAWPVPLKAELPAGVERTPAGVELYFNDTVKQVRAELENLPGVLHVTPAASRGGVEIPEVGPVAMRWYFAVDFRIPLHGSAGSDDDVKRAAQAFGERLVVPTLRKVPGVGETVIVGSMKRR